MEDEGERGAAAGGFRERLPEFYALREGEEAAGQGCRRILFAEIAEARRVLESFPLDPDAAVHGLRRHGKRVRSLLRLLRGTVDPALLEPAAALVRESSGGFSRARDLRVALDLWHGLGAIAVSEGAPPGWEERRAEIARRHREELAGPGLLRRAEVSRASLRRLEGAIAAWPWKEVRLEDLRAGCRSNLRKGRKAFEKALRTRHPEHCHRWRKRTKNFAHHCGLGLCSREGGEDPAEAAGRLASWLGEHHDWAVLEELLKEVPGSAAAAAWARERAASRRRELEELAFALGEQVFPGEPGAG